MVEEKVFCENCKYLIRNIVAVPNLFDCDYPKNIHMSSNRTWLRFESTLEHIESPAFINRFNNCPWFERKGEEDGKRK